MLLPCICNYVVSLCIADLSNFSLNNEGECIYKCLVMRLSTQSNMSIQYYSSICSGGSLLKQRSISRSLQLESVLWSP